MMTRSFSLLRRTAPAWALCFLLALFATACDSSSPAPTADATGPDLLSKQASADLSDHRMVLGIAEYITHPLSGEPGGVEIFQKDVGNGQLDHDFVYNDPRNAWDAEADLSFAVKRGNISTDADLTQPAFWMEESFRVWEQQKCSGLTLVENPADSNLPGLVENFFATGTINVGLVQADVTQVGFRGVSPIFPPGSNTLGVAYTLFWTDANGNFTDIDGNGKIDAALREIYYNDQYEWADNGVEGVQNGVFVVDFPSVAIHEAGHGLSAAHFGTIGLRNDGTLFATPRSIMNAIYNGTQRELAGRDVGSHCSNWAQWPGN